ncbi:uncharacterized protein LOC126968743 [Leptidea sinapis]|uniref:uncharacterized protein LOC126968743 n=1 Tax=Leptidea sinapis TaxID=189913 RepID=UPI0021C49A4A|nr:uncharacterized protein LOC126968743 [Leptidea sinapis]
MSPRLFAIFALFAVAAAFPSSDKPAVPNPITTISESELEDDSPWFSFPKFPFMNFFAPIWNLFPQITEFGPKIEVDDNIFKVIVNTESYKLDDLKVELKSGFVFIQGTHEAKKAEHDIFASQFFYTYTLPVNASIADVTAKLYTDNVLEISVPLNGNEGEKAEKRIVPIVETGVAYKTDKTDSTNPPAIETDERKEPTTPPAEGTNTIPEANEADNSAANEVQP